MAKKMQIALSPDREQAEWIRKKEEEGYSRPGLVRYAVKRLMAEQNNPKPLSRQEEETPEKDWDESPKKYKLEKIFEAMLTVESRLNKIDPNAGSLIREVQEKLKQIDHLSPRAAFELGVFKENMEWVMNRKLLQHGKSKTK